MARPPVDVRPPVVPAPKFMPSHYTVADIAEIKGVTPAAIHRDLHRQRSWKTGVVPAPDPAEARPYPFTRVLTWAADREDVRAFLADPSVAVWR